MHQRPIRPIPFNDRHLIGSFDTIHRRPTIDGFKPACNISCDIELAMTFV